MDIHLLLVIGHVAGLILGVGGATFIEIHLNIALKDNEMDDLEKRFLGTDFLVTRVGMGLAMITGLGFMLEYYLAGELFRLDGVFWSKIIIFAIIMVNAYLLQIHKIGLYWGSAFSFVSWWTVMLLGVFITRSVSIFEGNIFASIISILALYGVAIFAGALILHKLRNVGKIPPVV